MKPQAFTRGKQRRSWAFALFTAAIIMLAISSLGIAHNSAYASTQLTTSSLATQQGTNSDYAIIKSDGFLYPCDANGTVTQVGWGSNSREAGDSVHNVLHLFIAPDVTKITAYASYRFNDGTYQAGCDAYYGLSPLIGTYTPYIEDITFLLDSTGKSSVSTIDRDVFMNLKSLTTVKNLNKTKIASIPDFAFRGCSLLQSVALPNTCTTIGDSAFYKCTQLKSVYFGTNLRSIGENAFEDCTGLTTVDLPKTMKSLEYHAFAYCSSLEKVVLRSNVAVNAEFGCVSSTPVSSSDNTAARIYVPNAMYKTYTTNSDWTDFSAKIHPFGEFTVKSSMKYTGKALKPTPKVTWIGNPLVAKNYTVSYKNNTNVGTAKITVTGRGDFAGSMSKTFKIKKAANTLKVKAAKSVQKVKSSAKTSIKPSKAFRIIKNASKGTVTYKKVSGDSKINVAKNGKITISKISKKKTYTVKVKVTTAATRNYKASSKYIKLKIKVA